MKRAHVPAQPRANKPHFAREFGVTNLAMSGSCARDESKTHSDVDVLVRSHGPAHSRCYFGVQFYLEGQLGSSADSLTDRDLCPHLRLTLEREVLHA